VVHQQARTALVVVARGGVAGAAEMAEAAEAGEEGEKDEECEEERGKGEG
jgi:hypothetical protein